MSFPLKGRALTSTFEQRSVRLTPTRRIFKISAASGGNSGDSNSKDRQPWEFGRFLKTLFFFVPPEKIVANVLQQPVKMISALNPQNTTSSSATASTTASPIIPLIGGGPGSSANNKNKNNDVVLVTGATGGVGKRVVALLLSRGKKVRALVRDVEKAKTMLGGLPAVGSATLELIAADVVQPRTLLPDMFTGISSVICCTAVKVAPKEGDTVDRSKYYQGIKFYDPEIVGDTPEAVEYRGMQNLMTHVADRLGKEGGKLLFSGKGGGALQVWGSLDDVVMGGASSSSFFIDPSAGEDGGPTGVFSGRVTTANNGGFASVRSRNAEPAVDLSAYDGLTLRVLGDGRRYKCIIRTDAGWDTVGYTTFFDTQPGKWQTVQLPFSSFLPVMRARTVLNAGPFNTASIYSIQLMHSKFEYDGRLNPAFKEGVFSLPVQEVGTYLKEPVCPKFVLVSSAGVTRPNRPGIDVGIDAEPPAVKLNDTLGGLLTYKLKGEDVVRGSGVPFAIIRPVALTEEPAGAELLVDQGDTIKGKISREEIAELCVELLDLPVGRDLTFEIKSTVPFSTPFTVDPEKKQQQQRDWSALLQTGGLKQGVTGKTINGKYTGKEPEAQYESAAATGVVV